MSAVGVELGEGGFGNALFKYAFARAFAVRGGLQLFTTPWIGQKLFGIDDRPLSGAPPGVGIIPGFSQRGSDIIYTKAQVREWFKFLPEVIDKLKGIEPPKVAVHLRWGDFVDHHGFIAVSAPSARKAVEERGYNLEDVTWVCPNNPLLIEGVVPTWLPDFWRLMTAKVLFRGPSTFSWWAGTLGEDRPIFSPDQRGIPWEGSGRGFQDVPFVEGNQSPITSWWEGHSELNIS